MSLKRLVSWFFLKLSTTVVVSFVADYGRFNCQTTTDFMRATSFEFATAPAIKFTTCSQLAFIFSIIFLSILLHPFSPCAGAAILFDKFRFARLAFARLGNVYGCEGLAISLFHFYQIVKV